MYFTIQLVIADECGSKITEEIIQLEKNSESSAAVGLTLCESKQIMTALQEKIVLKKARKIIWSR